MTLLLGPQTLTYTLLQLRRVQVEKRCALERLQAVNRDFRSLCTPHLWKVRPASFAAPLLLSSWTLC